MITLVIVCITIFLIYTLKEDKLKRVRQLTSNIPGPRPYPIIGNGLTITTHKDGILKYLEQAQKKYGTFMKHWIGSTLYVHISDPDDVEIVLKDMKNITKSPTYDLMRPWLGDGLITATGAHWQSHRKALTPAFHFNILESFVNVFNEKGRILTKLLRKHEGKGMFNIYPHINLYALDCIIEAAMGIECNTQEEFDIEYVTAIHKVTETIQHRAYNFLLKSELIFPFTKLGTQYKKALQTIHDFCTKIINTRKEELKHDLHTDEIDNLDNRKKQDAFLTLLLKGQRDNKFSNKDIIDEVNNFIFGGHDTTTSAIAFAIYHLSRNQDIQQRVYDEIIDIFGNSDVDLTLQDLQKTKYIDQVIKEVLRISPPIPVVSRMIEKDIELSKHTLPKGCSVSINIYMLHRNPIIYQDPEVFNPERFSTENSDKKHPYAFVPFSAGLRNCIGQKFAMLEIKSTLIKFLKNFKILPGEDVKLNTLAVLIAENGINVSIEERK